MAQAGDSGRKYMAFSASLIGPLRFRAWGNEAAEYSPDALKRQSQNFLKHGVWIRVFGLWGFRFI